ncbi:helix-turn-helix domain-containing protein [Microbacterium laevaniformans]|uniref:helix-turn-helix domain-containing protein n=1 Tax=Microbacterium laevaniformans TaxID=36807 RepID=UPI001FCC6CEE|nr:helix-turn-helix transcriptional regulator [Microbacterium laevaniformans]
MDGTRNPLAEFLRDRRESLSPESVGLAAERGRRVAGLRRTEVAELAGISADYYLRLEQGRGHQPSQQVLSALSRAAARPLRRRASAAHGRAGSRTCRTGGDRPDAVGCSRPAAPAP